MENKTLEVFETHSRHSKLTITPSRVTIKLSKFDPDDEQQRIKLFGLNVVKMIGEVENSWRGTFNERGISMRKNYGKPLFFNFDSSPL